MCFNQNSTEDFGRSSTGGVPVPSNKPSLADNSGSVLGSIWNGAKGVFEGIANIELQKYAAERLADIRGVEEQAKVEQTRVLAGTNGPATAYARSSLNNTTVIAMGVLALGAVLLIRR